MKKLFSSILLVAGTSVGGGMIMLPAVVGLYGYISAISILMAVCLINILIALTFLEACCYLPRDKNLISMTSFLLGRRTKWFVWAICLGFLYTLMCVYISGLSEIVRNFLSQQGLFSAHYVVSFTAVLVISAAIFFGAWFFDYFNRFVFSGLIIAFFCVVVFLIGHFKIDTLFSRPNTLPIKSLPVVFTSFGFLIVIPSVRNLLDDDIKKIKIAIITGSLIPLVLYSIWITCVMGVIPVAGPMGLQDILFHNEPIKLMSKALVSKAHNKYSTFIVQAFIFFGIASSFVGTSLGLFDFIADGLKLKKTAGGKFIGLAIAFVPPLLVVLIKQSIFIAALGFAGMISTILFGLYPVALTWSGRYVCKLPTHYRFAGGRFIFFIIVAFCLTVIGIEVSHFFIISP